MADPIIRPYVPDQLPEGVPLSGVGQQYPTFTPGPSMDFTGRPVDIMQLAHSRRLALLERIRPEQEEYSRELSDLEFSKERQDRMLQELQNIIQDQAQYSRMQAGREAAGVPLNQMAGQYPPMPTTLQAGMYQAPVAAAPDISSAAPRPAQLPGAAASRYGEAQVEQMERQASKVTPVYAGGERVVDEIKISSDTNFNEAFKLARRAGASVFHWRGKTYSTRMK